MLKTKRNYHPETKRLLFNLEQKATNRFYVDFTPEGVFIETRMLPTVVIDNELVSDCYKNVRLEIESHLVLNEILDSLKNTQGIDGAYFCRDGVECFTFQYYEGR